jgi:metal-sulfur cluster biosynthetic enzyme
MSVTEAAIHEELKKVIDPELFVNVVDLGLIYVVNVIPQEGGETVNVQIDMTLTSPACPAGPQLIADVKRVVSEMEGIGEVEVKIVMEPMWSPDRMTDDARDELGIF